MSILINHLHSVSQLNLRSFSILSYHQKSWGPSTKKLSRPLQAKPDHRSISKNKSIEITPKLDTSISKFLDYSRSLNTNDILLDNIHNHLSNAGKILRDAPPTTTFLNPPKSFKNTTALDNYISFVTKLRYTTLAKNRLSHTLRKIVFNQNNVSLLSIGAIHNLLDFYSLSGDTKAMLALIDYLHSQKVKLDIYSLNLFLNMMAKSKKAQDRYITGVLKTIQKGQLKPTSSTYNIMLYLLPKSRHDNKFLKEMIRHKLPFDDLLALLHRYPKKFKTLKMFNEFVEQNPESFPKQLDNDKLLIVQIYFNELELALESLDNLSNENKLKPHHLRRLLTQTMKNKQLYQTVSFILYFTEKYSLTEDLCRKLFAFILDYEIGDSSIYTTNKEVLQILKFFYTQSSQPDYLKGIIQKVVLKPIKVDFDVWIKQSSNDKLFFEKVLNGLRWKNNIPILTLERNDIEYQTIAQTFNKYLY
ncbi:unnamed protein product [Ambrosiozyma monospora]|uniref:Unnamed protein product n=1 Tax=Ambrosiozyma monospora TaxID=43982 RepID=A0ACB5SWI9_AMBMO|nr:unnamed protein product [Ambrosiozyma monospora]